MTINNILSYIIYFIHFLIILLIILSPFISNKKIKIIAFILLIFLLMQYLTGYQRCGLTEFEYYIKGDTYKEGFLYRLIKPIITIPEKYFDKYIYILHIIIIIILGYQLNIIKYIKNKIY